jgi:hypothetical protein
MGGFRLWPFFTWGKQLWKAGWTPVASLNMVQKYCPYFYQTPVVQS